MSDHWASHDPSGDVDFDTTSLQDYHVSKLYPRRHGRNDDATRDRKQEKTYNGNARGNRDEFVPLFNHENGRKKHSKTRDNGYRKHDDLTDHIKAKYPQGASVRTRGEPTCTLMWTNYGQPRPRRWTKDNSRCWRCDSLVMNNHRWCICSLLISESCRKTNSNQCRVFNQYSYHP